VAGQCWINPISTRWGEPVVLCVVLFLLCVCVCDLFLFLQSPGWQVRRVLPGPQRGGGGGGPVLVCRVSVYVCVCVCVLFCSKISCTILRLASAARATRPTARWRRWRDSAGLTRSVCISNSMCACVCFFVLRSCVPFPGWQVRRVLPGPRRGKESRGPVLRVNPQCVCVCLCVCLCVCFVLRSFVR